METSEFRNAKATILNNLDNGAVTVTSKRTGEEFIIARQYNSCDGWFVYKGCDLIVGDVTLDHAIRVLLQETR